MTIHEPFLNTFQYTPLGKYLFEQEQLFVQSSIMHVLPERILQIGGWLDNFRLPERKCVYLRQDIHTPAHVIAHALHLPWQTQSFDVLVVAHGLDGVGQVLPYLTEWWRVLKPNGRLILTGFNPYSWWRWGGYGDIPKVAHSLPLHELKVLLEANHWQIEQGRFLNYLPPVNTQTVIDKLGFLEAVGNRWLPHGAAAYGLMLRKEVAGVRPNTEVQWNEELADGAVLALARNEIK